MTHAAIPPDARRIAIVLPSWVGDAVMATPALRAVRCARPGAMITGIMRPGLDEVLRGAPWLDATIVCAMKGAGGPTRLAGAIRAAAPEAVLLLPNNFRSALAARLAGAPVRIGYRRDGRGWLLTHPVAAQRSETPTPTLEYYLSLAAHALAADAEAIDRRMELFITDDERARADELLAGVTPPYIVLNPGGNLAAKRWPPDRFAAVAAALHESHGLAALITGAPREREIADAVIAAAGPEQNPIVSLIPRGLTLGALKPVLQRAAIVITNDTGPRHVAAALGRPLVSLFGPTDQRWTTIGFPRERRLLAEPFLPETLIADEHRTVCRIERITVNDVLSAARDLLNRT